MQTYLHERAITALQADDPLRFHQRCYYTPSRKDLPGTRRAWPAMIAAVTDADGTITGVHRTWIDPVTSAKAPVATPRRAMGFLLGHGVRFGKTDRVMAAGEGIETVLSLRQAIPAMSMIAALSSSHLSAIVFPPALRRLYVARDDDFSGDAALAKLTERASPVGVEVIPLSPILGDFNEDLHLVGAERMCAALAAQLVPEDAGRLLTRPC